MLATPERSLHGKNSQENRAAHHSPELADVDVVQVHGRGDGHPKRGFSRLLSRDVVVGNKWVRVVGSTTELNTLQMTNFLNKVQADAATEFGITLPLPADRHYQSFIDEYRTR